MLNFKINKIFYLVVFWTFFKTFDVQAKLFKATEFVLNNDLRVIVNENHKAPIAKLMLWYKVGSMDEASGKSGLAHLLEHLMFRGTNKVPGTTFNEIMLSNGVENNAFTSRDFTVYHALSDISRLELVMALEADRMSGLNINDEAFSGEQKIVYQERQQRVENNSKSCFAEVISKILWQDTPYEHPVSGTLQEIKSLSKADAQSFYHDFYSPSNAVLVISGDIMPNQAKFLAEKYFGSIQSKSLLKNRKSTFRLKDKAQVFVRKEMPHIENTKISISYIIPSIIENEKAALALSIFSNYLGESGNSYFKKNLIQKNKVLMASSDVDIMSRGSGTFSVSILPLETMSENESITLLERSIIDAVSTLSDEQLEKEKKKILSGLVYIDDNPEDAAYIIGHFISLGWSLEQIENYTSKIESISTKDVQEAVNNMLARSKKMTAVLAPQKEDEND